MASSFSVVWTSVAPFSDLEKWKDLLFFGAWCQCFPTPPSQRNENAVTQWSSGLLNSAPGGMSDSTARSRRDWRISTQGFSGTERWYKTEPPPWKRRSWWRGSDRNSRMAKRFFSLSLAVFPLMTLLMLKLLLLRSVLFLMRHLNWFNRPVETFQCSKSPIFGR